MRRLTGTGSWASLVLRSWITLWMLAVPLIHIHPETDPYHGEAGHVHVAAVHSVFSPDLEGEFDRDRHPDTEHRTPSNESGSVSASPFSTERYAELEFSVLSSTGDRFCAKPQLLSSAVCRATDESPIHSSAWTTPRILAAGPTGLFAHDGLTRAPPFPVA